MLIERAHRSCTKYALNMKINHDHERRPRARLNRNRSPSFSMRDFGFDLLPIDFAAVGARFPRRPPVCR